MERALRARARAIAPLALLLAALAGGVPAAGASAAATTAAKKAPQTRLCSSLKAKGTTYGLAINRGSVSCASAARTMVSFLSGGGTEHGGRSAPEARKYWTLSGGWKCTRATNGGSCFRDGSNYLTAREVIGTYSLTGEKRHKS